MVWLNCIEFCQYKELWQNVCEDKKSDELKLRRSGSPKRPGNVLDCIVQVLELFDDFIRDLDSEFVLDSDHDLNVVQFIDAWRYKKKGTKFPPLGIESHAFRVFNVIMKRDNTHDSSSHFVGVKIITWNDVKKYRTCHFWVQFCLCWFHGDRRRIGKVEFY